MIVIINIFKFRKWFKYGLKSKHPTAARHKWQNLLAKYCYRHKQHALKVAEALIQGLLWTQAARSEGGRSSYPRIVMDTSSTP